MRAPPDTLDMADMHTRRWFYFLILCLTAAGPIIPSAGMDIVRDGQANAIIVTPTNALPVVEFAAQELRWHVEKASGAKLTIVAEDRVEPSQTSRIYLGECAATRKIGIDPSKFPVNTGIVRVEGDSMFLVGRDGKAHPLANDAEPMGTLFAVYEWLETRMGVRWLWPGELGTYVPVRKTITSGPEGEMVRQPPFIHTRIRYGGSEQLGRGAVGARSFEKTMWETGVWLRRHRFARPVSFEYGHAFEKYWERFGKTHPEYFARRPDGVRAPLDEASSLVQMCVSSTGLHQQIIEDWLAQRAKDPTLPWINGVENDRRAEDPPCTCEACRAWDPAHPDPLPGTVGELIQSKEKLSAMDWPKIWLSDRYARFWLALQQEGRKHDPEATVVGLAYTDYANPPKEVKLNKRIMVWIVPPFNYPNPDKAIGRKVWDGWHASGASLVLRPNYFWYGYCMPYIFASAFGEDFRHARKNGMIGTDFDSLTGMWSPQGPNLYVLGRIHDRPDQPVKAILKEYYEAFGAASAKVREYFEYWEKTTSERAMNTPKLEGRGVDFIHYYRVAPQVFPLVLFEPARAMLKEAHQFTKEDPVANARVEFLQKGLEHAVLSLRTSEAYENYHCQPESEPLRKEYEQALQTLGAYRKGIEDQHVVNIPVLNFMESYNWDWKQTQMLGQYERIASLPLFWSFRFDPGMEGENKSWFASGWSASSGETNGWDRARVDQVYEQQEVGMEWKRQHGEDFLGWAWYRTTFKVPAASVGKRHFLCFGAVDESAKVWVNGKLLLERKFNAKENPNSWCEPFTVDITSAMKTDVANEVVVRVENLCGLGGIYRGVLLLKGHE